MSTLYKDFFCELNESEKVLPHKQGPHMGPSPGESHSPFSGVQCHEPGSWSLQTNTQINLERFHLACAIEFG